MKLKDTKIPKTAWDTSKDTVLDVVCEQVEYSIKSSCRYEIGALTRGLIGSSYFSANRSVWVMVRESVVAMFGVEILDSVREQVNEIEKIS